MWLCSHAHACMYASVGDGEWEGVAGRTMDVVDVADPVEAAGAVVAVRAAVPVVAGAVPPVVPPELVPAVVVAGVVSASKTAPECCMIIIAP